MEDLKQHLLVGSGIDQPVGAQQQEIPRLQGTDIAVALQFYVRAQGPGDQVPVWMAVISPRSTMRSTKE